MDSATTERRAIVIQGTVQGVGFRPYVYGLATRLQLGGFVRNQNGAVQIEVEGETGILDEFLSDLVALLPPLARIDNLVWSPMAPLAEGGFRIDESVRDIGGAIAIMPDIATCDACLRELMDPLDRRFGYPFLNCTHCGPRLTIVTGAPYDRERTTMASFPMCAACRAEYENPSNRRFHAQPIACPACGPRLQLLDAHGHAIEGGEPLDTFVAAIKSGKIGAMKGLGGYHLVCDACNVSAVAALRHRKQRDEKPFAVMVQDIAGAETLCTMTDFERQLILSHCRPIVLLRKRLEYSLPDGIASQNPFLGVMLPYTPLHHLLMRAMDGAALVMTSGNRSDEPIAIDEEDAARRLNGIAGLFLVNNRPIHVRCDDSVTKAIHDKETPIRRSRGMAPQPILTPWSCPFPILATGGQLKATFALGNDRRIIVSHHLGDLDHLQAYRAYEHDIALYEELFSIRPASIVHDLHPDYASTRYAVRRAAEEGMKLVAVQHHHAHMASCMVENGLTDPVIGVTFDGAGFGIDGAIWGGEFLVGDCAAYKRVFHLRYVGMPGGEQAAREPWRMAAAHLLDAQCQCSKYERRIHASSLRTIRRMLERQFNCPLTSSVGRLFDAVASLIGIRDVVSYEGQAAMQLEWLASSATSDETYPFATDAAESIDTRPLIRAIAHDVDANIPINFIAKKFHSTLAELIHVVCCRLRKATTINTVVFSGGVFINELLTINATQRLERDGFRVYSHAQVPTNDGGLSLGQLAVAASQRSF